MIKGHFGARPIFSTEALLNKIPSVKKYKPICFLSRSNYIWELQESYGAFVIAIALFFSIQIHFTSLL